MSIPDRQTEVNRLYATIFAVKDQPNKQQARLTPGRGLDATDAELIAFAQSRRNGAKFTRVWQGDSSDYDGDESRGDAGLVRMLLFYTGGDEARTDRLFRQSGRLRDKWDERRGAKTYGASTIERVRAKMTEFYSPGPRVTLGTNHHTAQLEQFDANFNPPEIGTNSNPPPPGGANTTGFQFAPVTSAEFDTGNYALRWLVKRLFVADQPCIIGGPQKVLKTSLVIDLVLSLGTGRPFLGTFDVYKPVRVAFLSGESGAYTIRETARRVALAKEISLADADVLWQFELPQLANLAHMGTLTAGLKDRGVKLLALDPLYLSLLAGVGRDGPNGSSVLEMGPLYANISRACLKVGVTPFFVHHTTKPSGKKGVGGENLDLTDLALAGVAEFARQWLLVWRRAPFDPGSGRHELMVSAGGSAGQSGLWFVDVNEGSLGDDFTGRTWGIEVTPFGEGRVRQGDADADRKRQAQDLKDRDNATRLVVVIDKLCETTPVAPYSQARALAKLNSDAMTRAVFSLVAERIIVEVEVEYASGKGGASKQKGKGLRRRKASDSTGGTDGTDLYCPASPGN